MFPSFHLYIHPHLLCFAFSPQTYIPSRLSSHSSGSLTPLHVVHKHAYPLFHPFIHPHLLCLTFLLQAYCISLTFIPIFHFLHLLCAISSVTFTPSRLPYSSFLYNVLLINMVLKVTFLIQMHSSANSPLHFYFSYSINLIFSFTSPFHLHLTLHFISTPPFTYVFILIFVPTSSFTFQFFISIPPNSITARYTFQDASPFASLMYLHPRIHLYKHSPFSMIFFRCHIGLPSHIHSLTTITSSLPSPPSASFIFLNTQSRTFPFLISISSLLTHF